MLLHLASIYSNYIVKKKKEYNGHMTDLSRDNKGGYPVKGYELTNELRDAVRDYCESRSFERKE